MVRTCYTHTQPHLRYTCACTWLRHAHPRYTCLWTSTRTFTHLLHTWFVTWCVYWSKVQAHSSTSLSYVVRNQVHAHSSTSLSYVVCKQDTHTQPHLRHTLFLDTWRVSRRRTALPRPSRLVPCGSTPPLSFHEYSAWGKFAWVWTILRLHQPFSFHEHSALGKWLSVFCSIGYALVSCDVTVSMFSAPKQLHHAPYFVWASWLHMCVAILFLPHYDGMFWTVGKSHGSML